MMADTTTSPGPLPRLCTAELPVAQLLGDILLDSRAELDWLPSNWLQDLFVSDSAVSEIKDAVEWELSQIESPGTNRWGLVGRGNGEDVMGRLGSRSMAAVRERNILIPTKRSHLSAWRFIYSNCCLGGRIFDPFCYFRKEDEWRRRGGETAKERVAKWLYSLKSMLTQLLAEEDSQGKKRDEEGRLVHAVAVYAVAVLASVYSYLVGLIDRGGTKSFSPGSPLFSSTFVSIVLVLAFYVWFKSRDLASRRTTKGYVRPGQVPGHEKFEARFKPFGKDNIYLGRCDTDDDAGIMEEIAKICYCRLAVDYLDIYVDGRPYRVGPIPPVPSLSAEDMKKKLGSHVRKVFKDVVRLRAEIRRETGTSANPPVQQAEPVPSVACDSNVRLEDMDSSMFDPPDNPEVNAESHPVHRNQVPVTANNMLMMFDSLGDVCFDLQPGLGTSRDSPVNNVVYGISSEVAVGGLANEGAARDIPQSTSSEFPPTSRPSRESQTSFEFSQQHSVPMTGLSNVDQPQNSTLDLPPLALNWVIYLQQQIEERDRFIVTLLHENERLRSNSQH